MTVRVGLDVGGAHLKVARVEGGRVTAVEQFRCRLWMGLEKLDTALRKAAPLAAGADQISVTMTGELSDVFPDRKTGVETLVARLAQEFGTQTRFWMGPRGFGDAQAALTHHRDVGSTNFLATAALVAQRHAEALLMDFGSTTADIIPIRDGAPCPAGLTDALRQTTGELVYTGFTRTAVMGVTTRVPFQGHWVTLAREYLATMADVRRILGEDLTTIDLHATADGKGKSVDESVARLARMLGRDASDGTAREWATVAAYIHEAQLRSLHDGALQVLSAISLSTAAPVIAAGIGAGDIAQIAARLGREAVTFAEIVDAGGDVASWATACAPAVSVALLHD